MSKILSDEIILPKNSKVGLFGGSFNPAHKWHYQVANEAYKSLGLDFKYIFSIISIFLLRLKRIWPGKSRM